MKNRLTIIIIAVCVFAALVFPGSVFAEPEPHAYVELIDVTQAPGHPEAPEVDAPSAILIDAASGAVLYSKDSDEAYYPASITKIMTAMLVIENCSLDDSVTFSYRATHDLEEGSSGIARTEGEIMSVRDCLYALLVASANEVAQALAEHVGGSIEAFAEMMNKKASALGCTNTHFANPSGLNNPNHYTTCHDMALILREAMTLPDFVEIASTTEYLIPATNKHSEPLKIFMKHDLLRGEGKYKYAVCGKTGYTSLAGFTLITAAQKDNMRLICVTMNCSSAKERAKSSTELFEFGFNNYTFYGVSEIDPSLASGGNSEAFLSSNVLSLSVSGEAGVVLPTSLGLPALTKEMVWDDAASENGRIGRVVYLCEGVPIGSAALTVNTENTGDYDFLGKSSVDGDVDIESDSDEKGGIKKALIIAGIAVAVIVVFGIAINRFINGSRRKRRNRKKRRKR